MVAREIGERTCHSELRSKVSVGLRIPSEVNDNLQKTRPDAGGQRSENDMDLRHGLPPGRQHRRFKKYFLYDFFALSLYSFCICKNVKNLEKKLDSFPLKDSTEDILCFILINKCMNIIHIYLYEVISTISYDNRYTPSGTHFSIH